MRVYIHVSQYSFPVSLPLSLPPFSPPFPPSPQMPLVQAVFESNVVQLTELIGQREDVNAVVRSV